MQRRRRQNGLIGLLGALALSAQADQVKVMIHGLEGERLQNAQIMTTLYQQREQALTEHQIRYLHKQAARQIQNSLEPFGYYQAQVEAELTPPADPQKEAWQAVYKVEKGDPVRLKNVNIELIGAAAKDPAFIEWKKKQPIHPGHQLNHALYEKVKNELSQLASERGYLDAHFTQSAIQLSKQENQADIQLTFDSGKQYCINEIIFVQDTFRQGLMYKYVPFQPGDPLLTDKLLDLQTSLLGSRYFSQINVTTEKAKNAPGCVNVKVEPKVQDREFYQARLGYGTDSGLRAGLDAGLRFINRHGHRLNGGLGISQNKNKHLAQLQYVLPDSHSKERYWDASLNYRAEDFTSEDIGEDEVGGETRVVDLSFAVAHHRERQWFDLQFEESIGVRYLVEQYELLPLLFTPEDQELLLLFIDEGQIDVLQPDFKVLFAELGWKITQTDDPIYTRHGYELNFQLRAAREGIAANLSFWQAQLGLETIQQLHERGRVIARLEAAYTDATTVQNISLLQGESVIPINANILPKLLQYRTGGDNSVRGFEFEEINGGENTLAGGKHLLTASLEYEYRFLDDWSLALFSDAGNVFNSYSELTFRKSAGLGVRWLSPVGLVRGDIAFPLKDDEAKSSFRFHLVIGPDF